MTYEGDLDRAVAGQAVTLTLAEAIDVARGDLIADANRPPHMADQFAAHLVWMHETPMLPGRPYLMRLGTTTLTATVSELKHQLDISSGTQEAAKQLAMNEIGFANLSLDRAMPFDTYGENRETGSFVLIDRISNATVGAGMVRFPSRRAANLGWHKFTVDKDARAAIKGHRPASCGSPDCRARANPRSPTRSRSACWRSGGIPTHWTATMSAMVSAATWASPTPTGSRTSGA